MPPQVSGVKQPAPVAPIPMHAQLMQHQQQLAGTTSKRALPLVTPRPHLKPNPEAAATATTKPASPATFTSTNNSAVAPLRRKSSAASSSHPKFSAISPKSPEDTTAASPPTIRAAPTTLRRTSSSAATTMISSQQGMTVKKTTAKMTQQQQPVSQSPSACSPPPIAIASNKAGSLPQISTSKVWVLPPRPKPGRKPSTDTPPTKRKAQNRAAQRAFRERRAARVVELEEMLTDVQTERDSREEQLSETLRNVSQENIELRQSLNELRSEIKKMQQQQFQFQVQQQQQQHSRSNSQVSTPITSSPFTSGLSPTSSGSSLQSYNIQKSYGHHVHQQQPQQQLQQHQPSPYQQQYSQSFSQRNNSTGSNQASPAPSGSTSYPPTMDQMASPAPSVESPLDILDRILEIRLPVPNKNDAGSNSTSGVNGLAGVSPRTANSPGSIAGTPANQAQQTQNDDDEDDGCGVCVKEDCICESLGIRPPRNSSTASTPAAPTSYPAPTSTLASILEPIPSTAAPVPVSVGPSVPLKRRRDDPTTKSAPIFKRIKQNDDNDKTSNSNDAPLEMDFTAMFARPKPSKKAQPTTSKRTSIDLPPLPPPQFRSQSRSKSSSSLLSEIDDSGPGMLSQNNANTPVDRCGFCSDGTPCLCAESAAQEASSLADIVTDSLPPMSFSERGSVSNSRHNSAVTDNLLPAMNGGTSRRDSAKLPSILPVDQQGGCTGNPGTCLQCQSDPMSTLFCTTLASRVSSSRTSSSRTRLDPKGKKEAAGGGGCCGGKGKEGGCCGGASKKKATLSMPPLTAPPQPSGTPLPSVESSVSDTPNNSRHGSVFSLGSGPGATTAGLAGPLPAVAAATASSGSAAAAAAGEATLTPPASETFIPCSAAYQTLSRHKDFKRVDLGKLVGRLTTRGMQVEVSSVANVLRELDRRLYD